MSCEVEIIEERDELDPLASNVQDAKVDDVKEEEEITEIVEECGGDPLALGTEVGKSVFSKLKIKEENMKEGNEMNREPEELEVFIIKEESIDEVETRAHELNQENEVMEIEEPDRDPLAFLEVEVEEKSAFVNLEMEKKQLHFGERRIVAEENATIRKLKKKLHKCVFCGKFFFQIDTLTQHILTHTVERPHKCKECGKTFSRKSTLYLHLLTHTGEKPHKCGQCGKSFSQKSNLSIHTLVHTGEKRHDCKECGKCFSLKSHLSRHFLTVHTGERRHHCEECGKCFSVRKNLLYHILTHTGERPHGCTECRKSFSRKSALSLHIRRFHM